MTTLTSKKSGPLKGTARVPGDKSISHRAFKLAACVPGESMIIAPLEGEDVMSTAEALRQMGVRSDKKENGIWHVHGVGLGKLQQPRQTLEMGNSGTTTRLLSGMIAGNDISATLAGDASLSTRDMTRVMIPLGKMGASFEATNGKHLPMKIRGTKNPSPITYEVPMPSAQVKSAILIAGQTARGRTTVIEKIPTRDHTEKMLPSFGVKVDVENLPGGGKAISVEGMQEFHPATIHVPGDFSSAAFLIVAALINEGSEILLKDVGINEYRTGLYTTLIEMGADIEFKNKRVMVEGGEPVADIAVRFSKLKGVVVPPERVSTMIDEIPILAIAAACADGTTTMTGLDELRKKESDRLTMVFNGLKANGVDAEMNGEKHSLTVNGTGKPPKGGAVVETDYDHRIVMAFATLGIVTENPVTAKDANSVNTSFPTFAPLLNALGADIS